MCENILNKMKTKIILIFLILGGCKSAEVNLSELPVPPPPPSVAEIPPAPEMTPDLYNFLKEAKDIQINSLPHPFNLNGNFPYAVWVDGNRVPLSPGESLALAKSLNLEFKQPNNTASIHNGEGWLFPRRTKKGQGVDAVTYQKEFDEEELEEEIFIDN